MSSFLADHLGDEWAFQTLDSSELNWFLCMNGCGDLFNQNQNQNNTINTD